MQKKLTTKPLKNEGLSFKTGPPNIHLGSENSKRYGLTDGMTDGLTVSESEL